MTFGQNDKDFSLVIDEEMLEKLVEKYAAISPTFRDLEALSRDVLQFRIIRAIKSLVEVCKEMNIDLGIKVDEDTRP